MNLAKLVALLFLLALSMSGCRTASRPSPDAGSAPRLSVDSASHDFGPSTEGDKLSCSFILTNAGSAPLVIERIESSCGCTAALVDSHQIAPNASTRVVITFDTTGRDGPNRKHVTLVSNDPVTPRFQLQFTTLVHSVLSTEPRGVSVSLAHAAAAAAEVWLTGRNAADARLKIVSVDNGDGLSVKVVDSSNPQRPGQGLRLSFDTSKLGSRRAELLLETGVPRKPRLSVPVTWTVHGNLEVFPPTLTLDALSSQQSLRVQSSRKDLRIRAARVAEGPFVVSMDRAQPVVIVVRAQESLESKDEPHQGVVEILSNDPLEPVKRVPIVFRGSTSER